MEFERLPGGRVEKRPGDFFGGVSDGQTEYWFHRNVLPEFKRYMTDCGYSDHALIYAFHDVPKGEASSLVMREHFKPLDYQVPIVDFLVEPGKSIRVATMQTGKGKTKTSLFAAAKIGEKFAVVVPAMYADMWYTELETVFHHKRGDILLIKGLKALKAALLTKASGENHASAYVITSTTIMLLIKAYESNPKFAEETVCRPEELYALLGLGYRVIDEVHKNSALNFKMDCYTNITKAVYLSATLDANEAFLRRMRQIAYPMNDRYDGLEYDRYINVVGLAYHADEPRKIRCKGYKGAYSHVVFEQWLMKNKRSLEKYMTFLDEIVLRKYIQVREPGQRCLVFASSVDFCTLYMKRLRAKYPQLKIGRYTQEDVYDDMLTNDITVSTVLSAGTGVDIPGLRIAIMSNSMDSPSANEQVKGRLRRLKDWPDVNPEFYYIFCSDIPKHVDYHNRKMDYFKGKCLSHLVYNSGYSI
jgi:superfamily II DNA or RNA helicase